MHFFSDAVRTGSRVLQALFAGILISGLVVTGAGCDGAGSGGDDTNDGDEEDPTVPAAPSSLESDAGDELVSLTWQGEEEDSTYNVYRETASTDGVEGSALATDISETSYEDQAVENGQTYYYRVTAVNAEGNESEPSGEAESTPFTSPRGLDATSGSSEIELEWVAATGASTYNVYRSSTPTDEATGDPLASAVPDTTYTDTSVTNGEKYHYRVTSVNPEEEESGASDEVERTPFSDPPPRP